MDVGAWQRRLEETFGEGEVVGPRLLELLEREKLHRQWAVSEFMGHIVLMNSFESFSVDTFRLAEEAFAQADPPPPYQWYSPFLLQSTIQMTRVRATETLLTVGYPMISYSLLRDVKDWAIFTAAIASGLTTRRDIEGFGAIDPSVSVLTDAPYATIHRSRTSEQDRVLKKMLREASDLDAGVVNELVIWERMFNSEVHGARLSFARHGLAWLRGEAPLPIGPSFDEGLCAMYLNRAGEVGWMVLRTYPLLQLGPSAFGAEWATKWQVLDESFRYYVKSLGKPIVNVIEKFVDKRFPFSPGEDSYERCPE